MGTETTHSEGRVVVHEAPDRVEVVQLPARDEAIAAASPATPAPPPAPAIPTKATPAVKAAVKQQAARTRKGKK